MFDFPVIRQQEKGLCCNLGLAKARNSFFFLVLVCVITVMLHFSHSMCLQRKLLSSLCETFSLS